MAIDDITAFDEERRSEPRNLLDLSYSVEVDVGRQLPIYQFKLRDLSPNGASILVIEGSSVLNHLKTGQKLKMKYWSAKEPETTDLFEAKIEHITKQEQGRFKGHYLIGLSILDQEILSPDKPEKGRLKRNKEIIDLTEANPIMDRTERRTRPDRRQLSKTGYSPEKRSGIDRRSGLDRRSGADRRRGVDRRSERNF